MEGAANLAHAQRAVVGLGARTQSTAVCLDELRCLCVGMVDGSELGRGLVLGERERMLDPMGLAELLAEQQVEVAHIAAVACWSRWRRRSCRRLQTLILWWRSTAGAGTGPVAGWTTVDQRLRADRGDGVRDDVRAGWGRKR